MESQSFQVDELPLQFYIVKYLNTEGELPSLKRMFLSSLSKMPLHSSLTWEKMVLWIMDSVSTVDAPFSRERSGSVLRGFARESLESEVGL